MRYAFSNCVFDTETFELRREGELVDATPQVLSILKFFLVSRSRLVAKDELVDEIWDGRAISDAAITVRMRALRQAIGDSGAQQNLLKTVRGHGYRFVGDVEIEQTSLAPDVALVQVTETPVVLGQIPSIAVLPFQLVGTSQNSDFLAQAIPDDILTALSRLHSLKIIARGSSFRFPSFEHPVDVVRDALKVDYCLSGQAEFGEKNMVLSLELVDTRSQNVVMRETHRTALAEVHNVREDVVERVALKAESEIARNEMARARLQSPDHLNVWQLYHQGMQSIQLSSKLNIVSAGQAFFSATEIEPNYARAHAGKSLFHNWMSYAVWRPDAADHLRQTEEEAITAINLDPSDPICAVMAARSSLRQGDEITMRARLANAHVLSPNTVAVYSDLARVDACTDNVAEALANLDQLEQLSPLEADHILNKGTRLLAHISAEDFAAAQPIALNLPQNRATNTNTLALAIAALSLAGDDENAARILQMARERFPGLTIEQSLATMTIKSDSMTEKLSSGLSAAGMK